MTAEVGHQANRVYRDQDGNFHLNGGAFYNDAEEDISDEMEALNGVATALAALDTISAAELGFIDGVTAGAMTASKALVAGANGEISGIRRKVNLAAATQTLTAAQSGEKFVGAVDAVFTLPAAAAGTKGVWYEFECGALSSGVGLSLDPAAADHIRGNGLTSVDNKDLINSGATDRLGDMVRVYCDGVDGWVIEEIIGTWAKEA